MKKIIGLCLIAVYFTACQSKTSYIDPNASNGKIVSLSVNQQDWASAAQSMINSLINHPSISKPGGPHVMMISRISNKTDQHIDTDLLIKKIRIALLKSGKIQVTTAIAHGGPEDASTKNIRKQLRDDDEFDKTTIAKKGTMKSAKFSLSGKIIQSKAIAGKVKQVTYTFQLSLTDTKTGLAVWEEEVEIIKQGKKSSHGW